MWRVLLVFLFAFAACVVFYKTGHEAGMSDGIEKERKRRDENESS